jgi:hypothetical protein
LPDTHASATLRSFDASVARVSRTRAIFPGYHSIGVNPKWPVTCIRTRVARERQSHGKKPSSFVESSEVDVIGWRT